jgi:uncharacterized protein (TIGR00369 family)
MVDSQQPAADWQSHEDALSHISHADRGGLGERMGMEWLETSPQRVVARIPVAGNTQPFGLLHGGASAVLAESTGSVLANLHAGEGRFAVGIELSCSHHRSARDGWVTAVATPLSIGRTLVTSHILVTDEADRPICTARLTCFLRDAD